MEKTPNRKIVLIDDDEVTNLVNAKLIRKVYDFSVIAYTNANEALEQLKSWNNNFPAALPDMIFIDLNMPFMDGWEFLDEFEKLPSTVGERCKVVMLTSSIDLSDLDRSKTYPFVSEFISKPLTKEKLRMLEPAWIFDSFEKDQENLR